jgi:hypothetical protein
MIRSQNNVDMGSAANALVKKRREIIEKENLGKVKKETKKIKEEDSQPRQKPVAIKIERSVQEEN